MLLSILIKLKSGFNLPEGEFYIKNYGEYLNVNYPLDREEISSVDTSFKFEKQKYSVFTAEKYDDYFTIKFKGNLDSVYELKATIDEIVRFIKAPGHEDMNLFSFERERNDVFCIRNKKEGCLTNYKTFLKLTFCQSNNPDQKFTLVNKLIEEYNFKYNFKDSYTISFNDKPLSVSKNEKITENYKIDFDGNIPMKFDIKMLDNTSYYNIYESTSGKVLNANENNLVLKTVDGSLLQMFALKKFENNEVSIANYKTGKCLTTSIVNSKIILALNKCDDNNLNQKFTIKKYENINRSINRQNIPSNKQNINSNNQFNNKLLPSSNQTVQDVNNKTMNRRIEN